MGRLDEMTSGELARGTDSLRRPARFGRSLDRTAAPSVYTAHLRVRVILWKHRIPAGPPPKPAEGSGDDRGQN
jgi:hypothetical protein